MVGIGFFAPLPLALMMPFMAGQSLLMGESFGKGFQYGKRKISSMSNEEFNKMTAADLGREIATDYDAIIPSLEQAVRASTDFQRMIFQEMGEILKLIPSEILRFFGLEGIEPGTETDKLSFNVSQVRAWTDAELRAAFENKSNLALYDGITQVLIADEYNKRFVETEPEEHVHEPAHHPIEETSAWLNTNATGLVIRTGGTGTNATWVIRANQSGTWRDVQSFNIKGAVSAITAASQSWPSLTYKVITTVIGNVDNLDNTLYWWVLKTKLP